MKLYNTLTRKIDEVIPLEDHNIKMYTCGLTVYSQPQIGNWVAYIYSDVLTRTLKASGYNVFRVQNITDVGHLVSDEDNGEDKMEKGARLENLTAWQVADKYIKIAHNEVRLLGLLEPDKLVRATELINEQIEFVKTLEQKGFTYMVDDGVYFDTSKLADYGKLAKLDIKGLESGARVDMGQKRQPTDFALWKFSPKGQQRDMEWDSPWGKGFPGWHLECSVIARQSLGDQIDIHTGGIDHIPVHHTNEIAQTETLTGKQFCNYWFHNNHMKINGTKLSKSLGNSYNLNDITGRGYSLDAFKLLVLSSHFTKEGNFTWEILQASQNRLNVYQTMADFKWQALDSAPRYDFKKASQQLLGSLQNNLNTPEALVGISQVANWVEQNAINIVDNQDFQKYLQSIDNLLGLHLSVRPDISDEQKKLLNQRQKARLDNNWEQSDYYRNELKLTGLLVKDSSLGQIWQRANDHK
jgi:cysteinyl-tRNA synthetase